MRDLIAIKKRSPQERLIIAKTLIESVLDELPSAQPTQTNTPNALESLDCISRQAAIDAIDGGVSFMFIDAQKQGLPNQMDGSWFKAAEVITTLEQLPSAQPERTCVNCGRTANNGGWYADGRTRCPIEEHYALPKDGYCHLWEKRNVTDDDYPERREE